MTNYKDYVYTTPDDFEPDLIDSIEHNRDHSAHRLLEYQKGASPRFLKLTWKQIHDGYFNQEEYKFNIKYNELMQGIYINITGIDTTLLTNNDRYFSCNLETALSLKKVHPLMVFVNKRFIRLSKIKLIRSGEWYTLFIKDIDPKTIVKSLDIILLPFNVIYEEDYGERSDLQPLYMFNKDGLFSSLEYCTTFYYIDPKSSPSIKHIGPRQYYSMQKNKLGLFNFDTMRFIWRYGRLETRRIDENNGVFMQFIDEKFDQQLVSENYEFNVIPSDYYGHVVPGMKIILYSGSTLVNPSLYRVIGVDVIYFENLEDIHLLDNRTITMQIFTDIKSPTPIENIQTDSTDIKITEVVATQDFQDTFQIPEEVNDYGKGYRRFLVFKGHVLLDEFDRYVVDYDTNTLKLTDPRDALPKGRHLLFVFVNSETVNAFGIVHPSPITFLAVPDLNDLSRATIQCSYKKITKNNSIVFINSTFVSPSRYSIENNTIILHDDFTFNENSIIMVILLEFVNELADPYTTRGKVIGQEIKKGRTYILYDLGISKYIKIGMSNLLCFDQNGLLITDLRGHIYNYNIIKYLETKEPLEREPLYLTCVYKDDPKYIYTYDNTPYIETDTKLENKPTYLKEEIQHQVFDNKANINRFRNEIFLREYIHGREEFYEMDINFDKLLADFNFRHEKDLTYGENLSKSLDYIVSYNQNRIDDAYEKKAQIFIKDYIPQKFNPILHHNHDNEYIVSLPRDVYTNNSYRTYPLFFLNGKLTDWTMKEDGNNLRVAVTYTIADTSKIKSINFRNLKNFLYPLNTKLALDNKTVLKDIAMRIIVSNNPYEIQNNSFPCTITVVDFVKYSFPCTIVVDDIIDPILPEIDFEKDIITVLPGHLTYIADENLDIVSTISVPREYYGIFIDYMDYVKDGIYYDLFTRITVENTNIDE